MPVEDYSPTLAQIGARLRMRTLDRGGNYLNTFQDETAPGADDGTQPTATQVEELVAQSLVDLVVHFGADIPEGEAREAARSCVALYTALQIELTYFAEQVQSNRSPYAQMKEQFDDLLPTVRKEVQRARIAAGDSAADVGEHAILPLSTFPTNRGGLVGWDTQF